MTYKRRKEIVPKMTYKRSKKIVYKMNYKKCGSNTTLDLKHNTS